MAHPLDYMAVYKVSDDPVEDRRRRREAMSKMWAHIAKVRSAERSPSPESDKGSANTEESNSTTTEPTST